MEFSMNPKDCSHFGINDLFFSIFFYFPATIQNRRLILGERDTNVFIKFGLFGGFFCDPLLFSPAIVVSARALAPVLAGTLNNTAKLLNFMLV